MSQPNKSKLSPEPQSEEYQELIRRPSLKDLKNKEYKDYRQAFEMFDKNKDGNIDISELENILKSVGHTPSRQDVLDVFRDVDKNQDGKIEFREFLYLMKQQTVVDELTGNSTLKLNVKAAFDMFDSDHDGKLTFSDIKNLMNTIGEKMTDQEIKLLIKAADLDKDGFINFQEFVQAMTNMHPKQ
jgi:Ca2+-binding EF-hand superfamily protein